MKGGLRLRHEGHATVHVRDRFLDGIAFYTNILALNAAVEAARAGEGRSGSA